MLKRGGNGPSSPRRSSVPDSDTTFSPTSISCSGATEEEVEIIRPSESGNSSIAALVVDDEEMHRKVASKFVLKGSFVAVFPVSSGDVAIERYKQHPEIGFVTMDYDMPGMNGMETILELKRIAAENGRELRVVGVTGEEDSAIKASMITAGAERVFAKPFEYVALGVFVRDNFPQAVPPRNSSVSGSF